MCANVLYYQLHVGIVLDVFSVQSRLVAALKLYMEVLIEINAALE